jgi:hypothetical protein
LSECRLKDLKKKKKKKKRERVLGNLETIACYAVMTTPSTSPACFHYSLIIIVRRAVWRDISYPDGGLAVCFSEIVEWTYKVKSQNMENLVDRSW